MPGPQGIYPHTVKDGTVRYEARVHQRAGQKPLSKTFRRLTDAKKWKRTMEGAKDRGEPLVADKRPLHEYLTSWLAAKASGAARDRRGRRRAIRARTLSDYQHLVKRWIERPPAGLPELGACRLDHLTTAVLDAFYAAMTAGKHTTARGVRSLNGVLGQALTEAVRKRLILHNPTDMADVPQVDVRPAVADSEDADEAAQAMDERQAAAFLAAAHELEAEGPFAALWHLLMQTALRPCEALALRWKDVDLEAASVRVHHSLVRVRGIKGWRLEEPKTKNAIRTVPLPGATARELRAWQTRQQWQRRVAQATWEEHGFVFTNATGGPLDSVRRSFTRVSAKAGLGTWGEEPTRTHRTGPLPARRFTPAFHPYSCRHTCITLWVKHGVPIHVVSKLAGHATTAFTLTVYTHALPEQQLEAAAVQDQMFGT